MKIFGWGMLAVTALFSASCDPCAGTPSCRDWPQVSATGQLVVHGTDTGVPDVAVTFVRASGVSLAGGDSIRGTTDDKGLFFLHAPATQAGTMTGNLVVTPPDRKSVV